MDPTNLTDEILHASFGPVPVGTRRTHVTGGTLKVVLMGIARYERRPITHRFLAELAEVCDHLAYLSILSLRELGVVRVLERKTAGHRRGTLYEIDRAKLRQFVVREVAA